MDAYESKPFLELPETVNLDVLYRDTVTPVVLWSGEWVNITIFMRTLTGRTLPVEIFPNETVIGLKHLIQAAVGTPIDQQRLIGGGKVLEDGRVLTADYGIPDGYTIYLLSNLKGGGGCDAVPRPMAWAVVIFEWDGEMKYPTFNGLPLHRGKVIVMTRILTPLWCEGYDPDPLGPELNGAPYVGFFPICYVPIIQFDDPSFRDELMNLSNSVEIPSLTNLSGSFGDNVVTISPSASIPPINNSFFNNRRLSWRPWPKLVYLCKRVFRKGSAASKNRSSASKIKATGRSLAQDSVSRGKVLETRTSFAWNTVSWETVLNTSRSLEQLSQRIVVQATKGSHAPPLPIFPYPDPDPPLFFRVHAGRNAATFVEVAVRCNALSSSSDTASVAVVLRCFPLHPMRISSVTFSLAFLDNQVSKLWPMEFSGPATEVNTSVTENKSVALQAGGAVGTQNQGINVNGSWSHGAEKTISAIYQTQTRLQGAIAGGNTARWTFTEDVAGKSGLPQETEFSIHLKYKPSHVRFRCHLMIANGAKEKSYNVATFSYF